MPSHGRSPFTSPLEGEVDRSLIGGEGGVAASIPPSLSLPFKGGGESKQLRPSDALNCELT
jgi:hypothetical protein